MPRCDSEWFKKQKNKSKARVFDLALQGAHHISISVLASVDGGASDSSQPLYSGPVLPALGKEGGRLFTSYSSAQNPNHKLPHDWCPPHFPDLRARSKAAWNPPQWPHRHRQWPPPSCPRPITQNISINLCPAASEPTQLSPLRLRVKIAALAHYGVLHVT